MNDYSEKIAILTGDPNGIGAEITIKALNLLNLPPRDVLIISNSKILNKYGSLNNNYSIIEVDYEGKIEKTSSKVSYAPEKVVFPDLYVNFAHCRQFVKMLSDKAEN